MKKIVISLLIPALILSGCGRPATEEENKEPEKLPFYIDISSPEQLSSTNSIEKDGTIVGAQSITVTSQVAGRIQELPIQEGKEVTAETTVIQMEDHTGTYSFNAQRARQQLNSARINYESTIVSLDKAISDTEIAQQQASNQFNSSNKSGGGQAAQQIEQIEQQIAKAELDYTTALQNDAQTIQNYIDTASLLKNDIKILYEQVRDESDKLLGVTKLNERFNDGFENELGVRNTSTKREAERQLRLLLTKEYLYTDSSLPNNVNELTQYLDTLKTLTNDLKPVVEAVDTMLLSTKSGGDFSEALFAQYSSTFNALKSSVQAKVSSITSQSNAIQSFLNTYQQQQSSLKKQVELTKQQAEVTRASLADNQTSAQLGIESSQNAYNTAIKSKDNTISALSNAISQAQIAVSEANKKLSDFSVKTPIQGTVGQILVDEGQEVSPGTPLFTISSTNEQQIEISLTESELQFAKIGDKVMITTQGKTIEGSIQSISKVASQNFTYKTIIALNENVDLLGDLVVVNIPITGAYPLIPVNVVTILGKNEGIIQTREKSVITPKKVTFGKVRGEQVEIISQLDPTTRIITSDVKNYNPLKFEINVKSKVTTE